MQAKQIQEPTKILMTVINKTKNCIPSFIKWTLEKDALADDFTFIMFYSRKSKISEELYYNFDDPEAREGIKNMQDAY